MKNIIETFKITSTITKRKHPTPWINKNVLKQIKIRNKLYKKFLWDNKTENWNDYKIARNKCVSGLRKAKKKYLL